MNARSHARFRSVGFLLDALRHHGRGAQVGHLVRMTEEVDPLGKGLTRRGIYAIDARGQVGDLRSALLLLESMRRLEKTLAGPRALSLADLDSWGILQSFPSGRKKR